MMKKVTERLALFFSLLAILTLAASIVGCTPRTPRPTTDTDTAPQIQRVAVVGFKAAIPEGDPPEVFLNPVTGSALMSYPVPRFAVEGLTDELFNRLISQRKWDFIPPGQARGVMGNILRSDEDVGMPAVEILQKIGNSFGADAVLSGYIYRWREREGTDFAVKRAASVAFDLYLVNPSDGSVMWRRNFNKTQRSLFENLFDFDTYLKSSGRWLTAGKLAIIGLDKMLSEMPGQSKNPKEK
jgi:hypothetical protein